MALSSSQTTHDILHPRSIEKVRENMGNKANKTAKTAATQMADDTIEIVCRGIGCNTGINGKYPPIKVPDRGRNTTLDELVILASKGKTAPWNCYSYIIQCTNKTFTLKGQPEDATKLMMTVAEVIEQHGRMAQSR